MSTFSSCEEVLSCLGRNTDPDTTKEFYTSWANKYEVEIRAFGYVVPVEVANTLAMWESDKAARILDAGAGTGLVGEVLQKMGYTNLDALDNCPAMLQQAQEKGIYNNLYLDVFSGQEPTQLPSNQYDVVVVAGVFGHIGADPIDEIIRLTKPGGLIIFPLREDCAQDPVCGFPEKLPQIEADKKVKLLSKRHTRYNDQFDAVMYVYRVLKQF